MALQATQKQGKPEAQCTPQFKVLIFERLFLKPDLTKCCVLSKGVSHMKGADTGELEVQTIQHASCVAKGLH